MEDFTIRQPVDLDVVQILEMMRRLSLIPPATFHPYLGLFEFSA
jgi:hypothetical protein